jgi:hypothetical protein
VKPTIDAKELARLYGDQRLTAEDTAQRLGSSATTYVVDFALTVSIPARAVRDRVSGLSTVGRASSPTRSVCSPRTEISPRMVGISR